VRVSKHIENNNDINPVLGKDFAIDKLNNILEIKVMESVARDDQSKEDFGVANVEFDDIEMEHESSNIEGKIIIIYTSFQFPTNK
jgi:hypothetical protein